MAYVYLYLNTYMGIHVWVHMYGYIYIFFFQSEYLIVPETMWLHGMWKKKNISAAGSRFGISQTQFHPGPHSFEAVPHSSQGLCWPTYHMSSTVRSNLHPQHVRRSKQKNTVTFMPCTLRMPERREHRVGICDSCFLARSGCTSHTVFLA